jgi:glucosamine kinase
VSVIVVGVDGGATKTRVLVADESGKVLGEHTGPASAVRPGEAEAAADVIATLVRDALVECEMGHVRPRALCAGIAGTGREDAREALWRALVELDVADETVVHSDAAIALDDAFGEGPGVLLVAGTGSMALGRGPTGRTARAGGWGPVIGDEGSGAWIGRRALGIVAAAADKREPETALTSAILAACEAPDVHALIAWAAAASPADLAALVGPVLKTAQGGDMRANALVALAVEELALHVRSVARELFGDERAAIPVALSGGMLSPGSLLRRRLEHRLKTAVPGASVNAGEVQPARGAVRGALRLIGFSALAT